MEFADIKTNNLKDYPVDGEVNQGTMFPFLPKYCSCGIGIGYYQKYIENYIGERLKKHKGSKQEVLSEIRVKMYKHLNLKRDCCLKSIFMYPYLTVNDIEGVDSEANLVFESDNGVSESMKWKSIKHSKNKRLFGYMPLKHSDNIDVEDYIKKLYDIMYENSEEDPEDENKQFKLMFPLKQENTKGRVVIKTSIPIPFEDEDDSDNEK